MTTPEHESSRTNVQHETLEHICTVTLKTTTMTPAFFGEIESLFDAIEQDDDIRVVIIRSEERAFCYGLDLAQAFKEKGHLLAGKGTAGPRTELLKMIRRWQRAFSVVDQCRVPVIAAIHGWCIGGGLDLISAADMRLCSEDARFSLREARIAIVADLGSLQRLPPIIGQGHTRELAYTAGDIDAARAEEIGLVNHVFSDKESLDAAASAMAKEIAANPPLAVQGTKNVLNHDRGKTVEEGLTYVGTWNAAFLQSDDLAEAISAFLSKRTPEFKGK